MRAKPFAVGSGKIITLRNLNDWPWATLRAERADVKSMLAYKPDGYESSLREDGKVEFYEVGKPRKIYASVDAWRVAMALREIEIRGD